MLTYMAEFVKQYFITGKFSKSGLIWQASQYIETETALFISKNSLNVALCRKSIAAYKKRISKTIVNLSK